MKKVNPQNDYIYYTKYKYFYISIKTHTHLFFFLHQIIILKRGIILCYELTKIKLNKNNKTKDYINKMSDVSKFHKLGDLSCDDILKMEIKIRNGFFNYVKENFFLKKFWRE